MSNKEHADPAAAARCAARAIDALRRGWPIRVEGKDGALNLIAIERMNSGADENPIERTDALLLSASRAATLKLVNQKAAADISAPVAIKRPAAFDAPLAMAIADPVRDLDWPMKGPFDALPLEEKSAAEAAVELARLAGLLPAFLLLENTLTTEITVNTDDVDAYIGNAKLSVAARVKLPTTYAENAEIVAFRTDADASEHLALIIGSQRESEPLVRLHSECLTGDIFGSLKCDCGPQLHQAMRSMDQADWGILIYLRQEGRGIGLVNKLRAYELQAQGYDTVDANLRLGFAIDARQFSIAAEMLRQLGVGSLKLMTNNPEKVEGLKVEGLTISERVPLAIAANPHNERYLDTKRDRTGHQL